MVTLEESKLFGQISPKELGILKGLARGQCFSAGQELFKEGDPGDGLSFMREGLVEISMRVGQETRHVISQVGAGDILGEMAVLEDKPRSASATAQQATLVDFFPRAGLLRLVESSPALALAFLREVSRRLREFDGQYLRE